MSISNFINNFLNNLLNTKAINQKGSIKKSLYNFEKISNLSDFLPYRSYYKDKDIYVNLNSCGFIIEVSPLIGGDIETSKILTQMITTGLPENCVMSFLNWASPNVEGILDYWSKPRLNNIDTLAKLAKKRKEFFMKGSKESIFSGLPYTVKNFRCFIVVSMEINKNTNSKIIINSLTNFRDTLVGTLKTIRLLDKYKPFPPHLLINFLNEILNPIAGLSYENLPYNYLNPINEQICDTENSVIIEKDRLIFEKDNIITKTLSVKTLPVLALPETFRQWQCADLIGSTTNDSLRMTCPFLSCFSFILENEEKEKNKMIMKKLKVNHKCGTKMVDFQPELRMQKAELDFVIPKIQEDQKIVKAFYSVTIFDTEENINTSENNIKFLYKTKGWTLENDNYIQFASFMGSIPFCLSEGLKEDFEEWTKYSRMVSWTCANLLPLQGEWFGNDSPCMLLAGRRGQLCFWDPFKNQEGNYNLSVVGPSGSGKSVFMQDLVASLRAVNTRVYAIDDGRSFMNLTRLLGGDFIVFSDKEKINGKNICVNPFSLIDEKKYKEDNEYRAETIELLTNIVTSMCFHMDDATDFQRAIIEKAVLFVWNKNGINANITDVQTYLLSQEDRRIKDLGEMLVSFAEGGKYSSYFHGQCNLNTENDFITFEMAELKSRPALQSIVLLILMFIISQKMYFSGSRSKRLAFVIDEAWTFLQGGGEIARFIDGFARRCRKYGGALITATQSILDYLKSPGAKACLNNSSTKCYLAGTKAVELKTAGLISTDDEMEKMNQLLMSVRMVSGLFSEVLISSSGRNAIVRLIEDSYSLAILSSKAEDFETMQDLQKRFGYSLPDAVEIFSGFSRINKILEKKYQPRLTLEGFVRELKSFDDSIENIINKLMEKYNSNAA